MKRIRIVSLICLLIFVFDMSVYAKSGYESAALMFKNIKITVDENELTPDTEPFIYNNRVYVPARSVAEAMGGNVEWDADNNTVVISNLTVLRLRFLGSGMLNAAIALNYYSDLLAAQNEMIDTRNNMVIGKGSNFEEILQRRKESLNELEKSFNDFIQKSSDLWYENTNSHSSEIQLATEITLAFNPDTAVTAQNLNEGINLFNWAINNIKSAYEHLDKYDKTQDPIHLQDYSVCNNNAFENYKKGYDMFEDLMFAFEETMYLLN